MQKPDLLIFPYNGNAIEALDCIGDAYRFVGFVDDTPEKWGIEPHGHPVWNRDALARFPDARILAIPGSPSTYQFRKSTILGLGVAENRYARVIHPAASVSSLASIGYNVLLMAGVVVTSNARIGSHICILPNTVVHHDAAIGDWSLIGSNVTIAGSVTIAENCYIGSGSSIMNGLRVGIGALVGLGSNVIGGVPDHTKVVGNPAREIGTKQG